MALVPGSSAGPYRIVEPLGRGGMASVYKAYEPKLDRYVALKVLPREFLHDPNFAQRFRQEAQVIARLEHPNIIPIYAYDIEEQEGIPWMAMRLIAGGSLSQLIHKERLALSRSVAILRGVADALDYAHAKGIVHRDVKPQNVLLDEASRVYLADFGIAKILESTAGLTATGMITGTPQYMAPEQATAAKIGPRADVYALGIVAYEMFTGRVPFAADTPVAVLMKHVQEPLPLPSPDVVPEPLLRALLRATAKKPEDRWDRAGAFVDALSAGLASTLPALVGETVVIPRTTQPLAAKTVVSAPAPSAPTVAAATRPAGAATRPAAATPAATLRAARSARPVVVLVGLGTAGLVAAAAVVSVAVWLLRREPAEAPGAVAAVSTPAPAPPFPTGTAPRPAPEATVTPLPAARASVPAAHGGVAPSPRGDVATASAETPLVTPATPAPTPTPTPLPVAAAEPVAAAVDPEVARLTAALADRDAATRRRAAQDLAARGSGAAPAVPSLAVALADRSADVRLRAAEALGRTGPAALTAVPTLAQALRDPDPLVAAEAAKALGLLGEGAATAAGPLGAALGHSDVAVRREAARALARLGRAAEPVLSPLIAALKDKDKTVRAQSARALGRIGPPARAAVPVLAEMSRDPDVMVSREARAALETIGGS